MTPGPLPPHDLDAEAIVLAALLDRPERIAEVVGLAATDYYSTANAIIAAEVKRQLDAQQPVDATTIQRALRDSHTLAAAGGPQYLAQLVAGTPAAANLAPHAERIRALADVRRLIATCQTIAAEGYGAADAGPLRDRLTEQLSAEQWYGARSSAFERIDPNGIFEPLPAIPWLVRGLDIAPGAPTLIAGYGFSGKTIAAQALAIAVASEDQDAWGLFPVAHGKVLHLDYEQGRRLTCERYQRIAMGLGIGPQDLGDRLSVVALPPLYLDSDGAESMLARELEGHALCIVDPFRGAAPAVDENCSRDVRHVLDVFTRVSERTGCVVVDLHHARKPQKDAPGGAKMAIRGSGDFYAGHGSVLIFEAATKGEAVRVSHDKARISGRLHDDFELAIDDEEQGGVRVTASLCGARVDAASTRLAETQRRVLEAIGEHPGATTRKLRTLVGGTARAVDDAAELLLEDGRLSRTRGENNSWLYYPIGGAN